MEILHIVKKFREDNILHYFSKNVKDFASVFIERGELDKV